jgi:Tfp pilus assembly protein PilF
MGSTHDMISGKQTAAWMIIAALALLVLTGCGSSSPGVKTAQEALKRENYEEALSGIERALDQDSSNTEAYLLRATVLRRMADSTMAPDEYKSLHRRAWEAEEDALSFDRDLREDVRTRRERVYEQEMNGGESAYNRANKNENQDLYRRSVSFFGAAGIALQDSTRPVLNEAFARLRVGERKKVIPILEEYVERADSASRKAYKVLGRLYLDNDQGHQAADLLDQATRTYPANQELQALRLNAYNQAGNADQALEAYREQVQKQPNVAMYRYNYGALLLEAERYADAIAQLKKAIEIQPAHLGSQYNLGAAYVNAALARDDSIAALEDGELSVPDTTSKEEQIDVLTQKRDSLFEKSVRPLERARKMGRAASTLRRDACRALMVAYVQTNRPNRAAQVEECTDFTKPDT